MTDEESLDDRATRTGRWRGLLTRFEGSIVGRVIISVGVVVALIAIVVVNMPDSQLRRDAGRVTFPVANATGLNQNWAIFADPRAVSAYVDGRIDFSDGSSEQVGISTSDWLGAYADYRWQKYEEIIRPASGSPYWLAYAQYLAKNARKSGRHPVRVTLFRLFAPSLPPGPGAQYGAWQESTMYVLTIGSAQ